MSDHPARGLPVMLRPPLRTLRGEADMESLGQEVGPLRLVRHRAVPSGYL